MDQTERILKIWWLGREANWRMVRTMEKVDDEKNKLVQKNKELKNAVLC